MRKSRLVSAICALVVLAVGCSSGSGSSPSTDSASPGGQSAQLTGSVTVFGYEDTLVPQVLGPFEKMNPGLTVRRANYGGIDEAVAKLQAGFGADVVNVCTSDTERMVNLGLLQPIDTSRIQDWNSVFPAMRSLGGVTVDGKVYMLPNVGGTTGIIYNPKEVPNGVSSYRQLFEDPALAGKVTFEDDPQSAIATTALALGYEDPWSLTDADLARIRDYWLAHRSNVRTLFKGDADFLNLYRSGEIVAGFGYHDYRTTLTDEGIPVEFVHPPEGYLAWVCGMGISSKAQNLDASYALLNWYLSPKQQAFYANNYNYVVSDQKTLALLDPKMVKNLGLDHPEQLQQAYSYETPPNYDQWLSTWRDMRS